MTQSPRRIVIFYPWPDFLERQAGASVRANLMVDFLSPRVEEIIVLQSGDAAVRRRGNVEVRSSPLRFRLRVLRRLFQAMSRLRAGSSRRDEGLFLCYHLERLIDGRFRKQVDELVSKADVVLLEYSFWAPVIAAACRQCGVPCILTQHDHISGQITQSPLIRRLVEKFETAGLRQADHVVSVSEQDRATFAKRDIGTIVIRNPVDMARMTAATPEPERMLPDLYEIALPKRPLCLFVGSDYEPNRIAAQHLRDLSHKFPHARYTSSKNDVEKATPFFVVAGGCATQEQGDDFVALGKIDDTVLLSLYQLANLVLIPLPFGTGSSLKTIEAMARGKVVIGTMVAFRGFDVRNGTHCIVEDDLSCWPNLISNILQSPEHLVAISSAAQKFAFDYDYEIIYQNYLTLLGLASDSQIKRISFTDRVGSQEHAIIRKLVARAVDLNRLDLARDLLNGLYGHDGEERIRACSKTTNAAHTDYH